MRGGTSVGMFESLEVVRRILRTRHLADAGYPGNWMRRRSALSGKLPQMQRTGVGGSGALGR